MPCTAARPDVAASAFAARCAAGALLAAALGLMPVLPASATLPERGLDTARSQIGFTQDAPSDPVMVWRISPHFSASLIPCSIESSAFQFNHSLARPALAYEPATSPGRGGAKRLLIS